MAEGIFGDLFGAAAGLYGMDKTIDRVEKLGKETQARSNRIGRQAHDGTEFEPFTVTANSGNLQVAEDGSIDSQLSAENQALTGQLLEGAAGFLEQAAVGPKARQQEIFEQLMSSVQPQQQRDQLDLEARQFAQGRGGITSASSGGTPQQLALAKAQAEQNSGLLANARGMGLAEQAQQGQLGSQYLNDSFMPEAQLFNRLSPGLQAAQLNQAGDIAGANLQTQARTAGLEARVNSEAIAAGLQGQMFNSMTNMATNAGNSLNGTKFGTAVNNFLGAF